MGMEEARIMVSRPVLSEQTQTCNPPFPVVN